MQKHLQKSINIILVPSQRYKDSRHLLQNPKVPKTVMAFSNRAQRFTGSNYLDVDSPLPKSTFFKVQKCQIASKSVKQGHKYNFFLKEILYL